MVDLSSINQGELFGTSLNDIKERIIYEASNKLPKKKSEILKYYKDLDEDLKSNFEVCKNIFFRNGMALSLAPDEIKSNQSLAYIAVATDVEAYDYVSKDLKGDLNVLTALIMKDSLHAFVKIPELSLKQTKISNLLFDQILTKKNKEIKACYTKPIINIIFSKNLSSTLASNDRLDDLISKFVSINGSTLYELPPELQQSESLIIKAVKADSSPQRVLKKLPKDFKISNNLYLKMIQAGASFAGLPAKLKKDVTFCEAAILKDPKSFFLISDELWSNRELSLKFLSIPNLSDKYWESGTGFFKTCRTIEDHHEDDKEIIYYLVKNDHQIKAQSKFWDNKKIVEIILKKSDSWVSKDTLEKFNKLSSRLKKDKDLVSIVLKKDFPLFYPIIDSSLKLDLPLLKTVLNSRSSSFIHFPKKLKDNKDIAKTAIKRSGNCYFSISERLKEDKEIVNLTLAKKPKMFRHIPKKYRENLSIATAVIKEDFTLIKYVGKKIRANKSFIEKAILCGASLKYASTELKKDKEIIKLAVDQYDSNLFYAHSEIKKDKQFLLDKFPLYITFIYCSKTILQDKEIFINGLNLDSRLIQRRKMSSNEILKMDYRGVRPCSRRGVFEYYKKLSKEKDIFLLANAKSIICGT